MTTLGKLVTSNLSLLSLAEMWYGVFLWALVSSLFFHVPAGLLALFTLRHHKYGRFMSVRPLRTEVPNLWDLTPDDLRWS